MQKKIKSDLTIGSLLQNLDQHFPFDLAEDWDNCGLLTGSYDQVITGIVVAINLGTEAIEEALAKKANVILCHHPCIFKPLLKLNSKHRHLVKAIKNDIAVISLHTNYDLASISANKEIAAKLGFEFLHPMVLRGGGAFKKIEIQKRAIPSSQKLAKLAVYVPEKDLENVKQALFNAGAGHIGNYSHCSFASDGKGTFLGEETSVPTVGKRGVLEITKEYKIEVAVPWSKIDRVVQAMLEAHSYEEVAYDVYEVQQTRNKLGYGFIASQNSRQFTFNKLLENVKKTFQLQHLTIAGPVLGSLEQPVRKIGFSPGSGSSFVSAASTFGLDAYICGEIGYHQILEARQKKLNLILLGHSYSEHFFMETISEVCEKFFKENKKAISTYRVYEVVEQIV